MTIVNYFEIAANFELPAVEAPAFYQAKGLKPDFAWRDMLGDEHDLAFTVAKMMDMYLPATIDDPVILDEITEALKGLGYPRA